MDDFTQGTDEWLAARVGRVTASRIADVMAATKSGPGAARKAYALELVAERLSGQPAERPQTGPMRWGIETEPQARASYTLETLRPVVETGFHSHPTLDMAGASPDGLVGNDGLVEIKCPNTATHVAFLADRKVDPKYAKQMQFQMACTDREWCDFVSFDPRLPAPHSIAVERVERDSEAIAAIEGAVAEFLAEIDAIMDRIGGDTWQHVSDVAARLG